MKTALPAQLDEHLGDVAADPVRAARLLAICHRSMTTRLWTAAGGSRDAEELRAVRRLHPRWVHRFHTLDTDPVAPDGTAAVRAGVRAAAHPEPACTTFGGPIEDWTRVGLASSLVSLNVGDEAFTIMTALPPSIRDAVDRSRQALAAAWPAAWAEHNRLVQTLVFTDAPLRSATCARTFGAIFVSTEETAEALRMFEVLVHESAHHALSLRERFTTFVDNPDDTASHPLRPDPRPLHGVLHAAFVLARLVTAVERYLRDAGTSRLLDAARCRDRLAELREQLVAVLAVLDDRARWTADGARLRTSLGRVPVRPGPVA